MKNYSMFFYIFISVNFIFSKDLILKVFDRDINEPLQGVKVYSNINSEINYTGRDGNLKVTVKDDVEYLMLSFELIGYQNKKVRVDQFDKEFKIEMVIENILEGKELVIEDKKMAKNEELGVSKVIDKNQLKSTSMSSMVQDVELIKAIDYII